MELSPLLSQENECGFCEYSLYESQIPIALVAQW